MHYALATCLRVSESDNGPMASDMASLLSGGRLRDLGPALVLVCALGRPALELQLATRVAGAPGAGEGEDEGAPAAPDRKSVV